MWWLISWCLYLVVVAGIATVIVVVLVVLLSVARVVVMLVTVPAIVIMTVLALLLLHVAPSLMLLLPLLMLRRSIEVLLGSRYLLHDLLLETMQDIVVAVLLVRRRSITIEELVTVVLVLRELR